MEQILLAAAEQLAETGKPEDLTTTSVSEGSGVPVATIYRYFADRSAIIAELIDREAAELDVAVKEDLEQLETVSIDLLLERILRSHMAFLRRRRRVILLWFGSRESAAVLERVEDRYALWGEWVWRSWQEAGLLSRDAPKWGGEAVFWLSDRVFEFIFRAERPREEQDEILDEFISMTAARLQKWATKEGNSGITREQFLARAHSFIPEPPAALGEVDSATA